MQRLIMRKNAMTASKGEAPTKDPAEDTNAEVKRAALVKVSFRTAGGMGSGYLHASGAKGATVVDSLTGQAHRVPHGEYMLDTDDVGEDAEDDDMPAAEDEAEEELDEEAVRSHLSLHPGSRLAVHAAAALAAKSGIKNAHSVGRSSVRVRGSRVSFGDAGELDDEHVAGVVRHLLGSGSGPQDPLWSYQSNGQPAALDQGSLGEYLSARTRKRLRKARPLDLLRKADHAETPLHLKELDKVIAKGVVVAGQYRIGDYTWDYTWDGAAGVTSCSGGNLPMPFHILATSWQDAQRHAWSAVRAFRKGMVPPRGLFRAARVASTPDRGGVSLWSA